LFLFVFIILSFLLWKFINKTTPESVAKLIDTWINYVSIQHNPTKIANLFCNDGSLVGTISQIKRTGKDIKLYFDYFANLPGIRVIEKKYQITKITDDVYINTAFITWYWDALEEPVVARMTFIIKNNCIFQLHSSVLPDVNKSLLKISGKL
jgi:hypothetical protein